METLYWSLDDIEVKPEEACFLCDCLIETTCSHHPSGDTKAQIQLYKRLCFHDLCDKCDFLSRRSLCEVCKHMRLGHIVRCGIGEYRRSVSVHEGDDKDSCESLQHLDGVRLLLGTCDGLQQRSRYCETCRVFAPDADRLKNLYGYRADDNIQLMVGFGWSSSHSGWPRVGLEFHIRLRIDDGLRKDEYIYEGSASKEVLNGSISLEMSAKRIHWPTVSLWLGNCDFGTMDHTVSCHKDTPPSILSQFRVIDTENQCVVLAPPFCKYAALSYVWGDTKGSTQALVSNIASLEKRGSLSETKVSLSAVIRDAMTVCRHLGVGYLWVDQLCILQDEDMAKKALHLNAMGEIYGNSYVTLVDLVGTNANHGLSGVGARQRVSRRSGRTQGLYLLGGCEPYDRILRRSKWMTRGWTFQESTLSPRLLLFSETMLTYECSGRNFVTDDERGNVAFSSKVKIPLGSYQDIVRLYTKRTLSFEPDILRAFAGILHAACGSDHYFGLPLGRFTQSLSWYTDNGKYYPRRETREGTEIFPSWSWSSTTSSIRFDMEDLRTITVPMALSAIPAPENKTQPFKVISDTSALGRAEVPPIAYPFYLSSALVLIQAWREGCFAETIPMELDNAELTWKQYLTIIRDKQSSLAKLCNAARGIDPQTFMVRDFHSKFPAHLQCKCEPGCVMVYTQSLRLRIVPATEGYGEPNLQDQQGRIIAWLLPHTANWNSITNTLTNGRTSQLDVIALSFETYPVGFEHHETYKSWQGYSGQEDLTWYDSSGKALRFAEKPRIQLMVVKTKNGISKRVALAETWLRVWIYAKPQFQTFILA